MADFVKVAALSELQVRTCKAVEANGKTIALFKVEDQVYALDNTCLHRGGPLAEGFLTGEVVTCPWHSWEYNVRTGDCLNNPAVKVASYPVQLEGDDVKVAV